MSKTVLIVDDNGINRQMLQGFLSKDYTVEQAANGQEALRILRQAPQQISAILLDIVMPVMDGYEVLEQMQPDPALSQIPVIVITGDTGADIEKKALASGANDFVTKPFDADIIKRRLYNLIRLRETAAAVNILQRDELTGLLNRTTFFERAAEMIGRQKASHYVLSCVDIDNFKVINDHYGSEKGDEVLRALAKILQDSCDGEDSLYGRISADNFIALYPYAATPHDAMGQPRCDTLVLDGIDALVSLSAGRYIVDDKSLSVRSMYDRAKIAQATIKGRYDAHMALYDESMRNQILREQEIVDEMQEALDTGQLEAWFQPQYNHSTGALIGAEALARWRHPKRGFILPAEFIPVFERSGFIYELDKGICEQACAFLRSWIDEGLTPLPISVNISRYDLFKDELVDVLSGLIEKYAIPADLLCIEITESAFAGSTQQIVAVVEALIARGFTVEIDDFGSGYSSFNVLKDVPAQVLKLDMRFLEKPASSSEDSHNAASMRGGNILESIVRMSKWLGMSVIAEGVERVEQADFLKSISCNYIQGFLYGRPMPLDEYKALAKKALKEEGHVVLETVKNFDNNAFWDPDSMDTLIFNSYVGAACIFEYHNGRCEVLRANDKYAQILGEGVTFEQAMALPWNDAMDEKGIKEKAQTMRRAIETRQEVSDDTVYYNFLGDGRDICIRSVMRVIASAGDRYLVYCYNENLTAQQEAEKKERETAKQLKLLADSIPGGLAVFEVSSGDVRVKYLSDGVYDLLGYPRDSEDIFEGGNALRFIFEEDLPMLQEQLDALWHDGTPVDCTYRIHTVDDGYKWLNLRATHSERQGDKLLVNAVFFDVTKAQETLQRLTMSEAQFRIAAAIGNRTFARYDIKTDTYYNEDEERLTQTFGKEIRNVPQSFIDAGIVAPGSIEETIRYFDSIKRGEPNCSAALELQSQDGDFRWFQSDATVIFDEQNRPSQAIIMFFDVTERHEEELRVREQAETDPLTGVLNRAAFSVEVERVTRDMVPDSQFALLMLDIDGFKLLNDKFGHAAGDQALVDIAGSLRSVLRHGDLLGRLGGDEFLVCLKDVACDSDIEAKAQQICSLSRKAFSLDVQISSSIGIAVCPRDGVDFDTLYSKADAALYAIKESGKNGFAFFSQKMEEEEFKITRKNVGDGNVVKQSAGVKRRMLIVEDNGLDAALLADIFKDDFNIERVKDGNSALIRLRHYGTAISVVLLDLIMKGMDGFEVLERMRGSIEMQSIPVVVVSGIDDYETNLRVIRCGATDFVSKPIDPDLLRIRVQSAISKAENERLRAQNSYLAFQNDDIVKYRTALENAGLVVVEHDWQAGTFTYDPSLSAHVAGNFDKRMFWQVLLSDMVAESRDVQAMQSLVHDIANDRTSKSGTVTVKLKTPAGERHHFCMRVVKLVNDFQLTDRLIMTFEDLDENRQDA